MAAVIGVGREQRHDAAGFGEDHLFDACVDLAPARRFLKRGGRAGTVAHVGDSDLDGIFMDGDVFMAEDFGADDSVLNEVLRHAATDHEEAGFACLDLDVGQFTEVRNRVDHHVGLAFLGAVHLMLDEAEAC